MAQQTEARDDAPDLAADAAALYFRCYDELDLPQTLAERIAGDFYQAMALVAAERLCRPLSVLSGGTPPAQQVTVTTGGQRVDDRTIIQRLRDQLGRGD